VKYAWIEVHAALWPIEVMCRMLEVSASGYFEARCRAPGGTPRQAADAATAARMAVIQKHHRGRYGRRRMRRALRQAGDLVNHKRVSRLMREHGLQSRMRRRFRVVTTDSRHSHPIAQNVLARDFAADAPNRKWLTDITYVGTDEGWLYCAFVQDLFSRQIVGWAMDAQMPQELTQTALRMALGLRAPAPGLMHHSDRGSQYAAQDYRAILAARHIVVSMSRRGDCWDNAPMESFNGTLKVECVYPTRFATRDAARQALIEYIGYYNTERMHSSLDYATPAAFEQRWFDQQRMEGSVTT
jgi:transposase InsO family protein